MNMEMNKNNPIKILFLTFEFGCKIGGGAGRVINSLVSGLKEVVRLKVCHLAWNRFIKRFDVHLHSFRDKSRNIKKYYFQHYLNVLFSILQKGNFNIVHIIHNSIEMEKCINIIKNCFPHIRIVYSCHSLARYEGNIRNPRPDHLESEAFILRNINHLHLLNKASLNYIKKSYPGMNTSQNISIIPNGVNEEEFKDQDLKWKQKISTLADKNEIIITCMSRWCHGKGLEYLLDAIPYILSGTKKKIKFLIAGRKELSWEHEVNKYVSMIDSKINFLSTHVFSMGWLNDAKRNALFKLTDIWVMPSLLEYFPYSITEPMINMLPILSSRLDPVSELLVENEECLFYEPTDPIELAEKIHYLINNKTIRKKIALNGYMKARKILNWENISRLYMKMYNNILGDQINIENSFLQGEKK